MPSPTGFRPLPTGQEGGGPSADGTLSAGTTQVADEVSVRSSEAADWIGANWQSWLTGSGQIVLIVLIAVVLRWLMKRLIDKVIRQAVRGARATVPSRPVVAAGASAAEPTAVGASTTGESAGRPPGTGLLLANALLVSGERRRQRAEAIGSVLRSVASFTIGAVCALTVLSVLNINLAPLLASAGVAGVAVGFGARNLVTDFLSGVFMILEDQYGVGDVVDAGVATGEVVEVGLRVTKLRGDNGEIWYVRNGEIKRIGNMSQGWSTATVDLLVGAREDLGEVRGVIVKTAEEMAGEDPWSEYLWEAVELLGVTALTAESTTLQLQAKTMPGKQLAVERELRGRLKEAFDRVGVRMTTPLPVAEVAATAAAAAVEAAPPSALNNPVSPQYRSAQPLAPVGGAPVQGAAPAQGGSGPAMGKPEGQ